MRSYVTRLPRCSRLQAWVAVVIKHRCKLRKKIMKNKLLLPLTLILFMLMVVSSLHMRRHWSMLCCICSWLCVNVYMHTCVSSYCFDLHGAVNQPPPASLPSPLTPPSSPLVSLTARGDVIAWWWSTNQPSPLFPAPKYWRAEISLFLWPSYFFASTSCLHAGVPGGQPVARGQTHRSSPGTQPLWPDLSPAH